MKIRWLGHSCYLITTADGVRILTDPFDEGVGYALPGVEADIVTVSHEHHDHNNVGIVHGQPVVVRKRGQQVIKGVEITGTATFHDEQHGQKRGENTLFKITADGISILHCGDLGHLLTEDQIAQVAPVDVLLIPVGGFYTIDSAQAAEIVRRLQPAVTIPMHYKTPATGFPITTVDPFLQAAGPAQRLNAPEVEITPETLRNYAGVLVLAYQ